MTPVLIRVVAELRAGWRAWLVVAVLVGAFGGVALAAATGARRAETAYPRFVEAMGGSDLTVSVTSSDTVGPEQIRTALRQIARFPQVESSAELAIPAFEVVLASGRRAGFPDLLPVASPDGRLGTTIDRFRILRGRAFDPAVPGEAVVGFAAADRLGLKLGDTVSVLVRDPATYVGTRLPVRLVGVAAAPGEFPSVGDTTPTLRLTPAFYQAHRHTLPPPYTIAVRLRHGSADVAAFRSELRALGPVKVETLLVESVQTASLQRTLRFESGALWLLSALVGGLALAVLGQAAARQVAAGSADNSILWALGMTRPQRVVVSVGQVAVTAAVGAALAAGVAVALSPLTPIGLPRVAELQPGVAANWAILSIGIGVIVVSFLGMSVFPAVAVARRSEGTRSPSSVQVGRPSWLAAAVAKMSRSVPAGIGVRMALDPGNGRTAVPVRSALVATTIAVAATAAGLCFDTSLQRLLGEPALTGLTWDVFFDIEAADDRHAVDIVRNDPAIAVFVRGGLYAVRVRGTPVGAVVGGGDPSWYAVSVGRAPSSDDEIALGAKSMRDLHATIGDLVPVAADDGPGHTQMRVVGTVANPNDPFRPAEVGEGAALTTQGFSRLLRQAGPQNGVIGFLIRFRPGIDKDAALTRLQTNLERDRAYFLPTYRTPLVASLARVAATPTILAILMAGLAVASLLHTLLVSVHRRRHDIAILTALGMRPFQVKRAIAWQATTLCAFALLIGVPLGAIAGRIVWRLFAGHIGAIVIPDLPVPALLLLIPATLALMNLAALIPGGSAYNQPPADALRTE